MSFGKTNNGFKNCSLAICDFFNWLFHNYLFLIRNFIIIFSQKLFTNLDRAHAHTECNIIQSTMQDSFNFYVSVAIPNGLKFPVGFK